MTLKVELEPHRERWRKMRRRSSRQRRGRVRVVVVVRNLVVSVVAEGDASVLEIRGVRRVQGGEDVARRHCLFHVEFSIFASRQV